MKQFNRIALLSIITVILIGCSDKEDKVVEPAVADNEEVVELKYTTPFTGEKVAEESNQRPILVTINNHPDARPQSGLGAADIVYEMLAEGEATRYLALYQSELPESVGPIRSARSYFIDLAEGLNAFYVAHGYSPEAKNMLNSGMIDHINGMQYDGIYFKRSSHRVAPHNSYISKENLVESANHLNIAMESNKITAYSFYEEDDNVKIGMSAKSISLNHSKSVKYLTEYHYNESSKTYERIQGSMLTTDEITSEPIALANIVFFEMPHRVIDQEGRREIDLNAGGKAYVAQHGNMREVRWENRNGQLIAIESDGSDVLLVPGQTWVHFVPTSPGITSAVTFQ